MAKKISIRCQGAAIVPLQQLNEFQGDLKTLSVPNYEKLRKEIIALGFSEPVSVWKEARGKKISLHILNGHQRVKVVRKMVSDEGYQCDGLPVSFVEADSMQEAKRKVLALTSQYGTMTNEGLHEFMSNAEISMDELGLFSFPDIDLPSFEMTYFPDQSKLGEEYSSSVILNNKNEVVEMDKLKPHPRNFRKYPDDQVSHIATTIKEIGIYRNVIVASDYTILLGHGIYEAVRKMKFKTLPVKRLKYDKDDIRALKILLNDNDLGHLAEIDDRLLTEILKYIKENAPTGLSGTGYDEKMLASLVLVTRPASEVKDINEAAEWVGMPDFEMNQESFKAMIQFDDEASRAKFMKRNGIRHIHKTTSGGKICCAWWPDRPREDKSSIKFASGQKAK